ncbi:MAG: NAD(P)-dependent oxidoreductase [Halorhodospira halophila]|uniref:NAD(P)-dependent oxidoreductase n=1 Tax=Halorhodospira TaxID=85108 RepID=UPI001912567E|nr:MULTISPECIES: NAD(P)-dependent oxidoreductase [Halorhodospira]MBK5936295.1 oxidoreductase [Halorhodospira halophila]MBK5943616.1 oxidoreductase [Halorhodospira halophila]MCC3751125.1 NAD(P)-dependent oxidoreductase [Halorhodospira halophila]MCG5527147.1 NAD(P)-dependent oxidoreductase [Halorhodospira halophila]MCG5532964.1 NAD(P)-dependent oxidoreductase [Halorhodospira sp. 9621]
MKAGVIGLGAMGSGLAANLARSGQLAAVWNRTREKAEAFAGEHGVALADEPATVATAADVTFISVDADADLLEVLDALVDALEPGKVVVDTSTVAPDTARLAAERIAPSGAAFLDAPVSGGPEGARQGTMVMMVGGDTAVLERIHPVLEPICSAAHAMGPVGAGQATKAVNQIMVAGIMQGVASALAYGKGQGLDLQQVIEVLGAGAASNWQLLQRGPNMVEDRFPPGFRLALHRKDLGIVRDVLAAQGIELDLIERTLADYDRLIEQGHGDEDISALYRLRRGDLGTD